MNQLAEAYLRRSKWIIGVLLATNLLAGGIGIYALRRTDAEYTTLFDQTVPSLNDLNRLTREISLVQRSLGNWATAVTPEEAGISRQRATDAENKAKDHLAEIIREQQETVFAARVQTLETSLTGYLEKANRFRTFMEAGKPEEALAFNRSTMRPAYEVFSEDLVKTGDSMALWGSEISDSLSDRTRARQSYILTVSGWPLVAIVAVVVFVAVVLSVLWFLALRLRLDQEP